MNDSAFRLLPGLHQNRPELFAVQAGVFERVVIDTEPCGLGVLDAIGIIKQALGRTAAQEDQENKGFFIQVEWGPLRGDRLAACPSWAAPLFPELAMLDQTDLRMP